MKISSMPSICSCLVLSGEIIYFLMQYPYQLEFEVGASEMGDNTVVMAFTEEQVERLTGISVHQLRYWDRTGFFNPSLAHENRRSAFSRIYSFRDVANLQVLSQLRNECEVPLQHLREVKERLSHMGDDPSARTTLYVLNKRVVIENPETRQKEELVSGQGILEIPLLIVQRKLESKVQTLWSRPKEQVGLIEQKRNVVHNKAVISGTRVPVKSIKAYHEAGYSIDAILNEYPTLQREDVVAAIEYTEVA